jgi:hypothetical protein
VFSRRFSLFYPVFACLGLKNISSTGLEQQVRLGFLGVEATVNRISLRA